MRNFLLGVLVGCILMAGVHLAIDTYQNFNNRLSAVEGYIVGLEMMRRGMR